MAQITIFTPTYNRAGLLHRAYEALKRQTKKDFIWLVVDDGSTDDTQQLVETWMKEEPSFPVEYIYKENGGLHTGYNIAIANIKTELCMCVDSDDYLPDDGIERILDFWNKHKGEEYAGIVGLDFDLSGNRLGDLLPGRTINLINLLMGKYKIHNADRAVVVRTDLYRRYAPMKVFPGEKYFNPHYMHLQISQNHDFLVLNENLKYVDYQADGMSATMLRQYKNSPNSFAETRKLYLSFPDAPWSFLLRHSVHLVSSCILAKKPLVPFQESPHPLYAIPAYPLGCLLALYTIWKAK